MPSESDGIDFEAEIAVMVDRVPMGTGADMALAHVKLLLLVNDASLRTFTAREVRSGFGFLQAKPSTSFAPVAITPDELGGSWQQARVRLPVSVYWNQRPFGHPHAGAMGFGFHELVAHAARTRNLSAGTIVGSGTISNDEHRIVGSACVAERRAIEMIEHGEPATQYMKFGDSVRIRGPRHRWRFGVWRHQSAHSAGQYGPLVLQTLKQQHFLRWHASQPVTPSATCRECQRPRH